MSVLADLTWPEVDEKVALLVPLGSTEQHGPHLPLSTDTDIARAVCRLAAARLSCVVAPALPYGASGEHQGFAGTLSIGTDALATVLVELVRSAMSTWRRVVLVSAHGGNADAVARAVSVLHSEGRAVLAWAPSGDGDAHAGRSETSLQLALAPHRVGSFAEVTGNAEPLSTLAPALRAGGLRAVSSSGVLGDPSGARAEDGHELLTAMAGDLVATIALRWPA